MLVIVDMAGRDGAQMLIRGGDAVGGIGGERSGQFARAPLRIVADFVDQADAAGFIKLNALRLRMAAQKGRK